MWFAKLFGIGHDRNAGPDPASDSTFGAASRGSRKPVAARSPNAGLARSVAPAPRGSSAGKGTKGFDPYNSGTFDRHDAWERVSRR